MEMKNNGDSVFDGFGLLTGVVDALCENLSEDNVALVIINMLQTACDLDAKLFVRDALEVLLEQECDECFGDDCSRCELQDNEEYTIVYNSDCEAILDTLQGLSPEEAKVVWQAARKLALQ